MSKKIQGCASIAEHRSKLQIELLLQGVRHANNIVVEVSSNYGSGLSAETHLSVRELTTALSKAIDHLRQEMHDKNAYD